MTELDPKIRRQLLKIVGREHLLEDNEVTRRYRVDWTGRFEGQPTTVLRPGSTEEVAALVQLCAETGTPVVPQGGNTGLVGGGVPLQNELVISLRRLVGIEAEDPLSGQLTVAAGESVHGVQEAADKLGWAYAVDLASRENASFGGTIATNAGGLRVMRNGDTRAQLLGIEAVTGEGRVVGSLSAVFRNSSGYHLPSLVCGSEGTLAIVTRARVRLIPKLSEHALALIGFEYLDHAIHAAAIARRDVPDARAVEFFVKSGLELVCRAFELPPPFPSSHGAYLLVEVAGNDEPVRVLAPYLDSIQGITDVAVAIDQPRRAAMWRYRELHTAAINTLGPPHKLDLALPLEVLAPFLAELGSVVRRVAPQAEIWLFGHASDGNVHVNLTGLPADDYRADETVFELAAKLGGSISAEHGIGTAKRRWLSLNRTPAELALFRSIKSAFDPQGILNPNVLLPVSHSLPRIEVGGKTERLQDR